MLNSNPKNSKASTKKSQVIKSADSEFRICTQTLPCQIRSFSLSKVISATKFLSVFQSLHSF